jgi:hypothetical protein
LALAAAVLWLIAVVAAVGLHVADLPVEGVAASAVLAMLAVLLVLVRRDVTRLQDRIILLEMKVRCAELLPAGEDAKLARLTPAQVIGLRFASDEELGGLLDRAVRENLSADEIKAAIRQWKPDSLRV